MKSRIGWSDTPLYGEAVSVYCSLNGTNTWYFLIDQEKDEREEAPPYILGQIQGFTSWEQETSEDTKEMVGLTIQSQDESGAIARYQLKANLASYAGKCLAWIIANASQSHLKGLVQLEAKKQKTQAGLKILWIFGYWEDSSKCANLRYCGSVLSEIPYTYWQEVKDIAIARVQGSEAPVPPLPNTPDIKRESLMRASNNIIANLSPEQKKEALEYLKQAYKVSNRQQLSDGNLEIFVTYLKGF